MEAVCSVCNGQQVKLNNFCQIFVYPFIVDMQHDTSPWFIVIIVFKRGANLQVPNSWNDIFIV